MPGAHRHGDSRTCGATTIVQQTTVFVNDRLWSIQGDPNTDGGGALIATIATTIEIENVNPIVLGDPAAPDDLCPIKGGEHCTPNTSSASSDVEAH